MIGESVWEACRRRGGCRYGLADVLMKHVPSGRRFVCQGSQWCKDGTLVLEVDLPSAPSLRLQEEKGDGHFFVITAAGLAAVPDPPRSDPEMGCNAVYARDCILLDRWPVVCCRPSRRKKVRS